MGFYRDFYIERTQRDAVWRNFSANRIYNKFLSLNFIGTGKAVYVWPLVFFIRLVRLNLVSAPDVTEKTYTFHEASQECKKVGLMLQSEFGIGRGDVVGFFLPSSPEYLTCLTGVIGIGAAATTINPAYTTQELTHQVRSFHSSNKRIIPVH